MNRHSLLAYLLLLLLSSLFILINAQSSSLLSNQWILNTNHENLDQVKRLVNEHNFRIVKSFKLNDIDHHVVESDHHHSINKRSLENNNNILEDLIKKSEQNLLSNPSVIYFERETILKRTKRDYQSQPEVSVLNNNNNKNKLVVLDDDSRQLIKKQLQQSLINRIQSEYLSRSGLSMVEKRVAELNSISSSQSPKDPMWSDMWYLNRNSLNTELPDMNVSGAWSQGYSGRGVSVTFLDDGLEHDHPDLKQNYDAEASDDINGNDSDPMPRYDDSNENKHGTRCAGEVAAVANNSICSVGVAFNAGVGGIRMLDGDVTDSVEARSLSFKRDHIDIYSASWGPDDNGEVVDGPGALAKQAFIEGVNLGRQGLGSIFVWASGNGGRFSDSCSCDGYANSIYTLSISSTSEMSEKPWYLEECTSTLATTYSSGDERNKEREIVTTDLRHQCTTRHTGTSAAAPLAAGIIALALEANSKLTWRDVMYLIVLTSRPKAIKSNNFIVNKRGFLVSSRYGFGLMDAGRMVELAKNWQNVPLLRSCQTLNSNYKM